MKCEQARTDWHDALDSGRVSDPWAAHVAQCGACRRYEAEMRWIVEGLEDLRCSTESIVSTDSSREGAGRPAKAAPFVRPWAHLLQAAALIALLLICAKWLLPAGERPGPTPFAPAVVTAPVPPVQLALIGVSREDLVPVMHGGAPGEPVQVVWLYPTLTRHDDEAKQP